MYIDTNYYGLWGLIAVLIIFILNRTIKPLLVWLTMPLTALTLGLFYPVINMLILKITDLVLFDHFQIHGILSLFLISIVISIMNAIMDNIIIDNLLKGLKK
jgi:putative membrane protein